MFSQRSAQHLDGIRTSLNPGVHKSSFGPLGLAASGVQIPLWSRLRPVTYSLWICTASIYGPFLRNVSVPFTLPITSSALACFYSDDQFRHLENC